MPWTIFESKVVQKQVAKLPNRIKEQYEFWKSVARTGPEAIRAFAGFKDEALKGTWQGFRSSRLSLQYRVIYSVSRPEQAIYVVRVSAHDYD
jgi:addiction module RelE/StbE family toxin